MRLPRMDTVTCEHVGTYDSHVTDHGQVKSHAPQPSCYLKARALMYLGGYPAYQPAACGALPPRTASVTTRAPLHMNITPRRMKCHHFVLVHVRAQGWPKTIMLGKFQRRKASREFARGRLYLTPKGQLGVMRVSGRHFSTHSPRG